MTIKKPRTTGSMFKRFFTLMTLTVLFSLTIASFTLMLSFMNFWKKDRLTVLSDDALSLARSVSPLYERDKDLFSLSAHLLTTEHFAAAFGAVADRSDGEVYIVDSNGNIIICKDRVVADGETYAFGEPCTRHEHLKFPRELITAAADAFPLPAAKQTDEIEGVEGAQFVAVVRIVSARPYYIICMEDMKTSYVPYTADMLRIALVTGFWAVAFAFVLSLINSHRMVKPLKKITEATKQYAGGNFSERIKAGDNYSELYELIESFNSMADSLQAIDESRSRFVADTSHELKTPMTIISGFVDGILDGTIPPEESEKYLRIVSDETKRLSRLVVAMLNISKIEADKLKLSLTDVDLSHLVSSTLLGFERAINEKNISVLGLSSMEEVHVSGDETLLGQIFYNLVDNAVKFTPDFGEISVRLTADKKNALLQLRNTGKGIPPEECPHIFDRFYKVDKSRGLDAKSFGIGLYIVRSIIEMHHGTITVESVVDEFTAFNVTLPLHAPEA